MKEEKTYSRKARLEDFLCGNGLQKHEENSNNEKIQKNQKEYGQRKRIKP
jgi:hypothetical protein